MLEADAICDRIAVIRKGDIVAEGTPRSIKDVVKDQGVVEFETDGLPAARIEALRHLDDVSAVIVDEREVAQIVTVHCARPGELAAGLSGILDGQQIRKLNVREPTLEDAYVQLIGHSET